MPSKLELMDIDEIEFAEYNPKRHDLQAITGSIQRYGYVEPAILNEKTQKLVAGQGRIESLRLLHQRGETPPNNIVVKGNKWFAPIIRGHEFENDAEAESYLIDSNNIGLLGGDFTAADIARLWDDDYMERLKELAENMTFPVSVTADDLDDMLRAQVEHADLPKVELGEFNDNTPSNILFTVLVEGLSPEDRTKLVDIIKAEGFEPRVKRFV